MSEIHRLDFYKKIKTVNRQITEIEGIIGALVKSINELSKFEKFSEIRIQRDSLYRLLVDVKMDKEKKLEILQRLENEKME